MHLGLLRLPFVGVIHLDVISLLTLLTIAAACSESPSGSHPQPSHPEQPPGDQRQEVSVLLAKNAAEHVSKHGQAICALLSEDTTSTQYSIGVGFNEETYKASGSILEEIYVTIGSEPSILPDERILKKIANLLSPFPVYAEKDGQKVLLNASRERRKSKTIRDGVFCTVSLSQQSRQPPYPLTMWYVHNFQANSRSLIHVHVFVSQEKTLDHKAPMTKADYDE